MIKSILVIDDEESVRRSFELALEDNKYNVVTASSGEEGVAAFKTHPFQLVFLDLKMPGMNGVKTLYKIKNLDFNVNVCIITAYDREFLEELDQARHDGMKFQLIRKPFGMDEIRSLAFAQL